MGCLSDGKVRHDHDSSLNRIAPERKRAAEHSEEELPGTGPNVRLAAESNSLSLFRSSMIAA